MTGLAAYAVNEPVDQEALVKQYAGLVKQIALHMSCRLPSTVQLDDIVQAGLIGLLDAARNFDQHHGAKFETYANIRIRGAILDEVRRQDWAPRSVHRTSRAISEALRAVENREGRDATDVEVAAELGVSIKQYHQMLQEARGFRLLSLDLDSEEDEALLSYLPSDQPGMLERLQVEELHDQVAEAINALPERERLMMGLYYDQELNLREIGVVFGVSESRVCQIHSQALLRLRARLAE